VSHARGALSLDLSLSLLCPSASLAHSLTHMMLKLLLLAAVIAAAASIDCETWLCTGADCTIAKVLSASACGADVNFCLTAVVSKSGSEGKSSMCDTTGACAIQGLTAGQCKTGDGIVGYCTTTTPPNGTIPTGTSCPTSAAPGQASVAFTLVGLASVVALNFGAM